MVSVIGQAQGQLPPGSTTDVTVAAYDAIRMLLRSPRYMNAGQCLLFCNHVGKIVCSLTMLSYYAYSKGVLQKCLISHVAMRTILTIPLEIYQCRSMFAELQVPTCQAVCRNLMFNFVCRLDMPGNNFLLSL